MANTYMVLIGFDEDITMNSGDGLFLVFCEHRKFCIVSSTGDAFSGDTFPSGDQEPGTIWPANGSPAMANTTTQVKITYTSRGKDSDCPPPGQGDSDTMPSHTITVG